MHTPRKIVIQKTRGQTPLEAIEQWKSTHSDYADMPASYAGRLDPMAEGKLLVLLGDECKRQSEYTKLDKEYVVEVSFDLSTDTGDVLGIPLYSALESTKIPAADFEKKLHSALQKEIGTHARIYPAFSSKTVHGKPLFLYALEGTVNSIKIPEHDETFYSISLESLDVLSSTHMHSLITDHLSLVPRSDEPSKKLGADFRQDEIREKWEVVFAGMAERNFYVARMRIVCGSGAYMRTFAARLGQSLDTTALALSITRTKIGKRGRIGPITFWAYTY